MDDFLAARSQMAMSLGFHIIFSCVGMVMPFLMAFSHYKYLTTKDEVYKGLTKAWSKGVAILFATGAVSGTMLSFELGLLWPKFMEHAGPIFGMPFSLEGKASKIFNSTGDIDIDHLGLLLDTNIQQFPLKILSQFIGLGDEITKRISATLGDTINALIHIDIRQLQGPVTANLSGSNGSIALNASVRDGILFLNQNFQSQIVLSKEFGKYVLEDIFPLASGLVGSDNPLNINIDAKGFSLPIKNFDLNRVKIETASLQMGKVRFRKEGKLGSVLSLFNTQGNQDISVWFTPLYISMKDGQMTFQRMDMLIMDAYPIATWGTVNFVKDKVNMVIGLTARALNTGLNIPGLDGDYMLQIPFKGTIDNASIDKKKATAKIAALVASNRGPEGLFIGTALRIASGELSEEKAPSPTTNPLPWQTAGETPTSNTTNSNHPLHQVEEKATSILKNILPF